MPSPMKGGQRLEVAALMTKVGDGIVKVKEDRGDTFICLKKECLRDALITLRDDPELDYRYFSECLGVDYSEWKHDRDFPESRFEVIYNLMSLRHFSRIFLKVGVNDGEKVPTVKDIFLGAEYPEREVQDMFGVEFDGNGPTEGMRFLLPDDWVGYPLRKEVPLGGEDVVFDANTLGPAVEDKSMPHAGESFEGKTGSEDVSGR